MSDIIQAQYDQLEAIAKRFQAQGEANQQLTQQVNRAVNDLQQGGWEGEGATAFFAEMNSEIFPAMQRLVDAFEQASQTTTQIVSIVQQAEEEADNFKDGNVAPIPAGAGGASALAQALDNGSITIGDLRPALIGGGSLQGNITLFSSPGGALLSNSLNSEQLPIEALSNKLGEQINAKVDTIWPDISKIISKIGDMVPDSIKDFVTDIGSSLEKAAEKYGERTEPFLDLLGNWAKSGFSGSFMDQAQAVFGQDLNRIGLGAVTINEAFQFGLGGVSVLLDALGFSETAQAVDSFANKVDMGEGVLKIAQTIGNFDELATQHGYNTVKEAINSSMSGWQKALARGALWLSSKI